jgi:hypothetical protein
MTSFQERPNPIEHTRIPDEVLGRELILDIEDWTRSAIWASDVIEQAATNPDIPCGWIADARGSLRITERQQAAARLGEGSLHPEIGGIERAPEKLTAIRDVLADLNEEDAHAVDSIFYENVPGFLMRRYDEWLNGKIDEMYPPEKRTIRSLGKRALELVGLVPSRHIKEPEPMQLLTMVDWLIEGTSDEELVNFLQWHNHRIESLQKDPTLLAEIKQQREIFKAGIRDGIEKGALDPVDEKIISKVDKVPILISDYFDTLAQDRAGYSDRKIGVFAEAATVEEQVKNIKYAVNHELNHVFGRLGHTYMDEALTEHIKLAMASGNWADIDPEKQPSGAYANCRKLVDAILRSGDVLIPATALTIGYYDTPNKDISKLMKPLGELMQKAYGSSDVVPIVNKRVRSLLKDRIEEKGGDEYDHLVSVAEMVYMEWTNVEKRKELIAAYAAHFAEIEKAA